MSYPGRPAAEQCEGCTFYTTQVRELSSLHSRDITYAVFGPYPESARNREFMGWDMPWYSAQDSLAVLLAGGRSACSTSCATCAIATGCSKPTGRPTAASRPWTTATRSWTSPPTDARSRRRTPPRLATTVHQHPDPGRPARLAASARVAGRAPHRPMAATGSPTLRRPRHRRALTGRAGLRTNEGSARRRPRLDISAGDHRTWTRVRYGAADGWLDSCRRLKVAGNAHQANFFLTTTRTGEETMTEHKTGTREEWQAALRDPLADVTSP